MNPRRNLKVEDEKKTLNHHNCIIVFWVWQDEKKNIEFKKYIWQKKKDVKERSEDN